MFTIQFAVGFGATNFAKLLIISKTNNVWKITFPASRISSAARDVYSKTRFCDSHIIQTKRRVADIHTQTTPHQHIKCFMTHFIASMCGKYLFVGGIRRKFRVYYMPAPYINIYSPSLFLFTQRANSFEKVKLPVRYFIIMGLINFNHKHTTQIIIHYSWQIVSTVH